MKPLIEIKGLSKKYRIGHERKYLALRDEIANLFKKIPTSITRTRLPIQTKEDIWAVKDISFDVHKGQAVGIIGRNGAGKTTLLKLISRITYPTKGEIYLRGRVASLLEVGTGFHSELTGRENIYFNGSIFGMKKREIDKKFDEMVAFAEVERFLDTPIKRYSSGMRMRLAFAVAAHLEPEILLIDEVIAVGDTAFQKKCLSKADNITREGRTVLFVSHNMGTIQQLCSQAILLDNGGIIMEGRTTEVVNKYLMIGLELEGEKVWPDIKDAPGDDVARLCAVRVLDRYRKVCANFDVRDQFSIELEYWVLRDLEWLDAAAHFYNQRGELIFVSVDDTADSPLGDRKRLTGFYKSTCRIPSDFLNNGQIYVRITLTDEMNVHVSQRDIVVLNIRDEMDTRGARGNYKWEWPPAAVRPKFQWETEYFSMSNAQGQYKKKHKDGDSNA